MIRLGAKLKEYPCIAKTGDVRLEQSHPIVGTDKTTSNDFVKALPYRFGSALQVFPCMSRHMTGPYAIIHEA